MMLNHMIAKSIVLAITIMVLVVDVDFLTEGVGWLGP